MENTSIKQNLENLSKIDTLSCGSALHLAKLDDQIGKKVAQGAKLKICAVFQKPQPPLEKLTRRRAYIPNATQAEEDRHGSCYRGG